MDIKKYDGYFHDGWIAEIRHVNNGIQLLMTSAEMDEEDIIDDAVLSSDDSIQGILHIEGVKRITENNNPFQGTLKMKYEDAGIFDFELENKKVRFAIIWSTFPPNPPVDDFSVIEIEAEKIWWENIPNLLE